MKNEVSKNRKFVFLLLLFLYICTHIMVTIAAGSNEVWMINEKPIPITALTGVFSSIANICIIFMVVFFRKVGFFTALVLVLLQFPLLIRGIVMQGRLSSIPGVFSGFFTIIAICLLYQRNKKIESYQEAEIKVLKERQVFSQRLFEQTATALVNAIDAKDTYSHGHSMRVAEYSKRIAKEMGMSEEECTRIFYAGLLHDVGKIGIPLAIINKKGKLTEEEYDIIKQHPVLGNQILAGISEYPYLSIGAHFHHERYDGKGYPLGLKGEDIPEIARIISVADAYDAMSSYRSYRSVIPQQLIREEIIKNSGTQFDPKVAKVMQHLIDLDEEYEMRERGMIRELAGKDELVCEEYFGEVSDGINLTAHQTTMQLKYQSNASEVSEDHGPAIVLFDSMDGRVHDEEKTIRDMNYFEYCTIWFDGTATGSGVRKIQTKTLPREGDGLSENKDIEGRREEKVKNYKVEALKQRDHVRIKVDDGTKLLEMTVALPDCSRFAYLSLTGSHCRIFDMSIKKEDQPTAEDAIARIAPEISYIEGNVGDIPNVQVDGYRTSFSTGIPVRDGMVLTFHTKSLPTARLVWHCPYVILYSSEDEKPDGPDYREYALIRLDGESWESDGVAQNSLIVNKNDNFEGWEVWKQKNKEGFDCKVTFKRQENVIIVSTENFGLFIKNTTTILDGASKLMVSLTGDQVALTNVRIKKP